MRTLSDLETQTTKTKGLQSQITTKARCKIHRWIHIQSNVNVLIKYIIVIPNFTVPNLLLRSPSDQDNLHPLFLLASLLSHLYWILRVLLPIPIQSPTSDHSGPDPHQMLTQVSNNTVQEPSALHAGIYLQLRTAAVTSELRA